MASDGRSLSSEMKRNIANIIVHMKEHIIAVVLTKLCIMHY